MRLEIELVEQSRMSLLKSEHPKSSCSHKSRESEASAAGKRRVFQHHRDKLPIRCSAEFDAIITLGSRRTN
ncbi:MAG: hypothetical protein ACU0A5_10000, partial [Salipiger marinus]|uniref:hypothetical protein n=1 Tax=Salipiger marinus TaxID=555512 RepID=UPI0040594F7E